MRQTKKITLSAMLVALGVAFMALGVFVEVVDLSACAVASLLVVFAYIEIGSPYTWLIWLCTSLAAFICFPSSMVWLEYLAVFGIYPLIKAYVERLPRAAWGIIKLAFVNAVIWILIFAVQLILGTPFFSVDKLWMKVGLYLIMNVAFFAYDVFITVMVRFYMLKLRNRFKRFLK